MLESLTVAISIPTAVGFITSVRTLFTTIADEVVCNAASVDTFELIWPTLCRTQGIGNSSIRWGETIYIGNALEAYQKRI